MAGTDPEGADRPQDAGAPPPSPTLREGAQLGARYEIVRLLGRGGMGAVYLARDRELGREVAVKLIAPHLAADPQVIDRFKREIQLSTRVTHPNVLRVFDLGESAGQKFLTMQHIDGETLADVMTREGPIAPDRAVALFRQICRGLAAAHEQGIVHRDLKPSNVMVDAAGTAYLTDFGLAAVSGGASTGPAGVPLGTPQYMSPEAVKGEPIEPRADVFGAGVILYEMLAGASPFAGDSVFAVMMARMKPPPAIRAVNPAVTTRLAAVLERCLAVDPARRHASAGEVLADLEGAAPARRPRHAPPRLGRRARIVGGAVAAIAVIAAASIEGYRRWSGRTGTPRNQTVLIADFDNRTDEAVFAGTLEPALGLALEGASFLTVYARASAQKLADSLKLEGAGLVERRARLVAQREGIGVVVAGFVEKDGAGYRLGARAVDAFTGRRIAETVEAAASKEGILAGTSKLAASIRAALGDATPESVQLREAETFSAASLEAAHEYSVANDLVVTQGRYDDAKRRYLEAIRLDPGLGRAYSGIAVIERNLGRRAEAERFLVQALEHVDRMSEREKLRTRGLWFMLRRDDDKTIETYAELAQRFPSDNVGLANLAVAYGYKGDFARALENARRAVALSPGNVPQRNNLGLFALYVGELDEAIREQAIVLDRNPQFAMGYFGLALAQLAAGRRDEALATWRKLEALGPGGASGAAEGLADLAVYEGRLADARAILERAAEADRAQENLDGAARKLAVLAEVHLAAGDDARAAAAAERALGLSADSIVVFTAARVLAEIGREKRALALADALEKRLWPEHRMFAEVVRGAVEARRKRYDAALARLRSAVQRLDSWVARLALGRTYAEAGRFREAAEELARCEARRGQATDVFQENVPTFRLYPAVRYWLARAQEGAGDPAAAETFRSFLVLKRSDEDPLVADARRRAAGG